MAFRDLTENDPLRCMLETPREGHLFDNDVIFTNPRPLQGIPVARITEEHEYWSRSWKSLDEYIAGEQHQEHEKERYKILENSITGATPAEEARKFKEKAKLHSDNVSKQRKIREIFGSTTAYHPNQVVAKEYLPPEGLCEQEIAYKLACKISDLQVLRLRGELAMDPFDFIRWRIALKILQPDIWKRDAKSNPVRSIITKLGDDGPNGSSKHYEDPLFRAAILRSARFQGHANKFGPRKKAVHDTTDVDPSARAPSSGQRRRRLREPTTETKHEKPVETKEQLRARLRERRQERAKLYNSGYGGTARRGPGA